MDPLIDGSPRGVGTHAPSSGQSRSEGARGIADRQRRRRHTQNLAGCSESSSRRTVRVPRQVPLDSKPLPNPLAFAPLLLSVHKRCVSGELWVREA